MTKDISIKFSGNYNLGMPWIPAIDEFMASPRGWHATGSFRPGCWTTWLTPRCGLVAQDGDATGKLHPFWDDIVHDPMVDINIVIRVWKYPNIDPIVMYVMYSSKWN